MGLIIKPLVSVTSVSLSICHLSYIAYTVAKFSRDFDDPSIAP